MIKSSDFGNNFIWGVSTAAFQNEGSTRKDGRGESIWDEFCKRKNKVFNNQNADHASDFYNRYAEDIYRMHELNIPNFRFSISWPRIFPLGTGNKNQKGIDFYNKIINLCLELGIEPWITLYHWDLPLELQKKGGWANRDVIQWFGHFVETCIKYYGDRVKNWIVLNEPLAFTGAGYLLGLHAPGKRSMELFLKATHHACLCQAEGGRIIRSFGNGFNIGSSFSYSHIDPFNIHDAKDIAAARKADSLLNRLFLEPLLGLGYPIADLNFLQKIEKFFLPEDEKRLKFDMDFIGLQIYTREVIRFDYWTPYIQARIVKADQRLVRNTTMNWEIYPSCISKSLIRLSEYEGIKKIIITENGASFNDVPAAGRVTDKSRILYLESHLNELLNVKKMGININGYFVWTLTDNFEWAEGYRPRFGLVYVDFNSQERIIKDSGYWFSQFLKK
jgi:beta-glucosidase